VAGVDFMLRVCELASGKGSSVYFLGGRGGVAQKTERIMQERFPSLHSAGYSEDIEKWRNTPGLFKADIIFVALGAPRQEQWMNEAMPHLPAAKILMAVGGSFDMISGAIPRAPGWLRSAGLEWFWRFALEPRKRFMRICNAVVIFPLKAFVYALMH
jgi:N-acetylglucosaminyldiphosphoundecaprenol N-acetyl-beta-D-mannosaminyltransferase